MASAMSLITGNVSGYMPTEGRCLPFSGISAATMNLWTCSSHAHYKYKAFSKITISMNRSSKAKSYVCRAASGSYRRNPDFSKQNRHGFSRILNQHNEEGDDNMDQLEDSESFFSKYTSGSNNSERFQAKPTGPTPGPREKEIVELFRKVQVKLRQRGDKSKEDNSNSKKIEDSQPEAKQAESVDSLIDVLRKPFVSKGKFNNSNTRDFGFDSPERKFSARFGSNNVAKQDIKESQTSYNVRKTDGKESQMPFSARPPSSFQKRSPITKTKYQKPYSIEEIVNINGKRNESFQLQSEPKPKPELESDKIFDNGKVFANRMVDDSDDDDEDDDDEEEDNDDYSEEDEDDDDDDDDSDEDDDEDDDDGADVIEEIDYSGLKVAELRAMAKSRGIRGYSKLKKSDLLVLLSGSSD